MEKFKLMPSIFGTGPPDIETEEKRSKYTVCILGCNRSGVAFAKSFAEAGFQIICYDPDQSVVKRLAKGKTTFADSETEAKLKSFIKLGQLSVTGEPQKAVSKSDLVIITVPAKVDDNKKIDSSELLNILKTVGGALHPGMLILYGEVAGLGFIEGIMKESLENTSGLKVDQDFGIAYAPLHNSKNSPVKPGMEPELLVASTGKNGLEIATNLLRTIMKVKPVSSTKVAEIATLAKAAWQDSITAFANELAVFCETANADYFEMLKLLDSKELTFWPKIVEQKNESYLLLESAENLNAKLRLPKLANQINEDMVKHAINITQEALRSCNKTLRRARVAILGDTYPSDATKMLITMLEQKGAKATIYDNSRRNHTSNPEIVKNSLNETVEGVDCIMILRREEPFNHLSLRKLKALTKTPSAIIDLAGAFEPQEIETEGFIYRGLGRGTG